MSQNTFGQWLRWRREGLDLTQKALAQSVGCSEILIRKLEADTRQPSLNIVQLLVERLGVSLDRRAQFTTFARSGQPSFAPFAYWTATGNLLTNLAVQPARLIGRDKQVVALCDKFRREEARLLTLVGPPGIGKTRLAIECAWQLMDHFEEGVYFVPLDRIDSAELVPSAITEVLGLSLNSNQPPLKTIVRYLQNRHLLLVLDNFEHVIEAASQVADLLAVCPFVHVLVTSRARLRLREEHIFHVPPLTIPQESCFENDFLEYSAINLFVERAKAVDPDFALSADNAAAVLDICTRLDGLPLAIELIAAYIKVLSPLELVPLLNGRFVLHSETQVELASKRHQTLKAAIDSSYHLLIPSLQCLFAQLSVFAGGWNLKAAQAVCEIDNSDILKGLMVLFDRSLIQQEKLPNGETRFKMLVPVREYAAECLEAEGLTGETKERYSSYFCDFAEEGGEKLYVGNQHVSWLERFDSEYTNLRSALDWCEINSQRLENRLRLINALEWYWVLRERIHEGYQYSQRALTETRADGLSSTWARTLTAGVRLALFYGDFSYAAAFIDEVLKLYTALQDKQGIAFALIYLGYMALVNGNLDGAELHWQESLVLAKEDGEPSIIAFLHFFVGNFYCSIPSTRNLDMARKQTEQGLITARQIGNIWMMSLNLMVLAHVNLLLRNLPLAITQFEECFMLSQALRDRRGSAAALNGLAKIALLEGFPERAKAIYIDNLQFFHEMNYRAGVAESLFGLAETFLALDQARQTVQLLAIVEPNLDFHLIVPIDREQFQSQVAEARNRLGDTAFTVYWMLGQTLDWEQITPKVLSQL